MRQEIQRNQRHIPQSQPEEQESLADELSVLQERTENLRRRFEGLVQLRQAEIDEYHLHIQVLEEHIDRLVLEKETMNLKTSDLERELESSNQSLKIANELLNQKKNHKSTARYDRQPAPRMERQISNAEIPKSQYGFDISRLVSLRKQVQTVDNRMQSQIHELNDCLMMAEKTEQAVKRKFKGLY